VGSPTAFSGGWEEALRYVLGIGTSTDTSTLYDDVLHGGAGDDLAFGGPGSDNMMGGDGDDTLHGDYGGPNPVTIVESDVAPEQAATIRALLGKPGDDYVDGGQGNDVISDVDGGQDILIGGDGADILLSEDPADSLAAFHNLLDGGEGNDSLISDNRSVGGHDTLLGAGGDDVIEVKGGSAYVEGGSGSDTYIVRDGFSPLAPSLLPQSLVINDFDETGDDIDRLQIALWSPWTSLSITRDETNLHFGLGGNPNWITVENWFNGSGHKIEEIYFDDMTTPGVDQIKDAASIEVQFATATDAADLLWGRAADEQFAGGLGDDRLFGGAGDDILAGNEGNDTLDGGEGSDRYVFNIGDGIDRIFDSGNFGSDVIGFGPGIAPESLTLGLGSMRIRVGEGGDAIHIDGFDPANARGSGNIEYFEFADGTMLHYQALLDRGFDITGTDSDDILVGTSVNDLFAGGLGNDTYIFGRGAGQDLISDQDSVGVDTDAIRMGPDIAPSDVTVKRDGAFINLAINGSGDQVSVRWQDAVDAGYGIERVEFADGTTWTAARLEEFAGGEGTNEPPAGNPPASPPDDAEDPPVPHEFDCRDLIGRRGHDRRDRDHRNRRRDLDHHDNDGDDSKRVRDRVAECLAAHLAHRSRFEFEALLKELEGAGRGESTSDSREYERAWRAVARFAAAHSYERDDSKSRSAAIFSQPDLLASSGFGGFFGSQNLTGRVLHRDVKLQTFRGLEDGFRYLYR
jgi:Ca2+-binding RTX toxin-like protein